MQELLTQLGINWKLLLSQAANFLLLLILLRLFVYKPLLSILTERRARIEEGLAKAQEADDRLRDVNEISKKKIQEAEGEAVILLQKADKRAADKEAELLVKAKEKEALALAEIDQKIEFREKEADEEFTRERARIIKDALAKVVHLSPQAIDDALIAEALTQIQK